MILGKYSIGIGDRFAKQGKAQLSAIIRARQQGINVTPVWNKSHREHSIVGTIPADARKEADEAVAACGYSDSYFVDADHISLANINDFIESSDFFTLDVADLIGKRADKADINAFLRKHEEFIGSLKIPDIDTTFEITEDDVLAAASKFLLAIRQAGKIYRHIASAKGEGNFITELSMDETDRSQSPVEMLFILAAIADEGIPAATIAPKFTGRFNKGVDYAGDVAKFAREFEQDVAVIDFAMKEFSLPDNLKLSMHSGSDKFSIYPLINRALKKFDVGLHIKTAGTTWLEELIGLASTGGDGLDIAKEIYMKSLLRIDELCQPYATVIDIDRTKLPTFDYVNKWDGQKFASVLRHDQSCPDYNPHFRQLLHVSYKIAAEMGGRFLNALDKYEDIIAREVAGNIYERHIKPIFNPASGRP
jgi:hypothetical protein